MNVYQIYDQATDAYTAWAADDEQGAIAQYVAANPPNLTVTIVWPNEPAVEGDDVSRFPVEDWQSEVINNDTRLGYAEWLAAQLLFDLKGV